jgi:hypothetical protein
VVKNVVQHRRFNMLEYVETRDEVGRLRRRVESGKCRVIVGDRKIGEALRQRSLAATIIQDGLGPEGLGKPARLRTHNQ